MLPLPSFNMVKCPCFPLKIKHSHDQNLRTVFMITWKFILKF